MSIERNQGMDPKTAAVAGVAGGGSLATLVVSLVMSNMGANAKMMQAENKITIEMVRQNTQRLDRYEERVEKKNDQFEEKQDKILELVTASTRDRFTKLDHEKHTVKSDATHEHLRQKAIDNLQKINRLESRMIQYEKEK